VRVVIRALPLDLEPRRVGWAIEGQLDAVPGCHRVPVVRGDEVRRWRWRGGLEPFAPSAESEQVQQSECGAASAERWASRPNAHVQGEFVSGVGAGVAQSPPRRGALVQCPVRVGVSTFLLGVPGEQPALAVFQDDARDTCQPFPPVRHARQSTPQCTATASSPTTGVC